MSKNLVLSKENYAQNVKPFLVKEFNIKNVMDVPYIKNIVVSTSLGADAQDKNYFAAVYNILSLITGQKCVVVKMKKSVAAFKTRAGTNSGYKVTLRRDNMYDFLNRLIYINLPRIRDFKGFNASSVDSSFNFHIGIKDVTAFHEVDYGMISRPFGISITFVIDKSYSKEQTVQLLKKMLIPIK
jgi:large subunit ribosomal protein L5